MLRPPAGVRPQTLVASSGTAPAWRWYAATEYSKFGRCGLASRVWLPEWREEFELDVVGVAEHQDGGVRLVGDG